MCSCNQPPPWWSVLLCLPLPRSSLSWNTQKSHACLVLSISSCQLFIKLTASWFCTSVRWNRCGEVWLPLWDCSRTAHPFLWSSSLGRGTSCPARQISATAETHWMDFRALSYSFGDSISTHILGGNYECISLAWLLCGLWLWLCVRSAADFPLSLVSISAGEDSVQVLALWCSSVELKCLLSFWCIVYHGLYRYTAPSSQRCINNPLHLPKHAVS